MDFPSKLIENAVGELARLPGIGKKTALRLALHLLKAETEITALLAEALAKMRFEITYCRICHSISDSEECSICANKLRDHAQVCVVADVRDVIAIENTGQYRGVYHVLGGVISPIEGVGPSDLHIDSLVARANAADSEVREIILAISPHHGRRHHGLLPLAPLARPARLAHQHHCAGHPGGWRTGIRRRNHAGPLHRGAATLQLMVSG